MNPPENVLDIAQVTAKTGLPASTLRHWEAQGLIEPVGRRGLRRQYSDATLDSIAHIRLAQAAGFSLAEIAAWIGPGRSPEVNRSALRAKADELDLVIRRLEAMRDGLRHSAECPAPSHSECPKFQELLRAALVGRFDRPSRH
ncbi:MAG: helix-turn-helix domain-containing protein [Acidobacteriota bacterium]